MRLLLDYGLRKGALKAIQFKHFDHHRKRLTVFTKGEQVRELPLPHPAFWFDLERHIQDMEAQPQHYLMQRQLTHPVRFDENGKALEYRVHRCPSKPMGAHGLHKLVVLAASRAPASSRRGRRAASGCTRPATPPASGSSTRPAT